MAESEKSNAEADLAGIDTSQVRAEEASAVRSFLVEFVQAQRKRFPSWIKSLRWKLVAYDGLQDKENPNTLVYIIQETGRSVVQLEGIYRSPEGDWKIMSLPYDLLTEEEVIDDEPEE